MNDSIPAKRKELIRSLFHPAIPRLWCPPLTHYAADGSLDYPRIAAHLDHLAQSVRSFLLFGSTGDGWELGEKEMADLLDFFAREAARLDIRMLVGVLRPEAADARRDIEAVVGRLKLVSGCADPREALRHTGVCGFTVCAARGADRSQEHIKGDLAGILDLGYPTAIYQLPQVTQNEFSPDTFADLASRFDNLFLMKDSSGQDVVAASGIDRRGVFMVRGGEGDYDAWYPARDGRGYDGFLLGSANCFAREHKKLIEARDRGDADTARALSERLTRVVVGALELAAPLPFGNAFANSNKAFDHFFAHGPGAAELPPPLTHSGQGLPPTLIRAAGDLLRKEGLMPEAGYLAD